MAKMKKCKSCEKELAGNAKTCPECGGDQRSFFGKHKILTVIGVFVLLGMLGNAMGSDDPGEIAASIDAPSNESAVQEDPTVEEPIVEEPVQISEETISQKNAVKMAEQYLDYSAFSRSGLIEQLEYEGFSSEDATYAVGQKNVDWKKQAVAMAEEYLDYSAFSRSGLIEQLEYEGFNSEEATYAVDQIGL